MVGNSGTSSSEAQSYSSRFALASALGGTAIADDTEVLIGSQLNPGNPNVVFLIDTSGVIRNRVVSDLFVGTHTDLLKQTIRDAAAG